MLENVEMPEGMNTEIIEHLMYPKNYGKLENPSCTGIAMDEKSGEYVIFYTLLENDIVTDVKFATNGCQDTVVVGSMFTEMIKGENTDYVNKAMKKMVQKLGNITPQQQICAELVLNSFAVSMVNFQNLAKGQEEEAHILKMDQSCEIE